MEEKKTRLELIELLEQCAWYSQQDGVPCVLDNAVLPLGPGWLTTLDPA